FYCGKIDELRVLPREMCREEIAATWRRLDVEQPAAVQLYLESHDKGFPMPGDPASRVQRENRLYGHALGYAAAQAADRANLLPTTAYGERLERWERMARTPSKPGDWTEKRRARVTARLSHRAGASIEGMQTSLAELVDTAPENIQILAFSQTTEDDFAAA